jgi:hypothetical protein
MSCRLRVIELPGDDLDPSLVHRVLGCSGFSGYAVASLVPHRCRYLHLMCSTR